MKNLPERDGNLVVNARSAQEAVPDMHQLPGLARRVAKVDRAVAGLACVSARVGRISGAVFYAANNPVNHVHCVGRI